LGYLSLEGHRKKLAQTAVEIIQAYQERVNATKVAELESATEITTLPGGLALEGVDTKCLALPFPVEAILPTTRLIFAEMKHQIKFAMSDKQINNISTGTLPEIHPSQESSPSHHPLLSHHCTLLKCT
jgi:hypothetical protein